MSLNSMYVARCKQALNYLDPEITRTALRAKRRARGMTLFADALARSAGHGEARPQLKATSNRGAEHLAGWNIAYALTYPFLLDSQP
jgi:hypothetical protein